MAGQNLSDTDRLIGRLLGDARERAGLSQLDAANTVSIGQSLLAKLEVGQRHLLFSEAVRLADAYGCDLDAFNPAIQQPLPRSGVRRRRIPNRSES